MGFLFSLLSLFSPQKSLKLYLAVHVNHQKKLVAFEKEIFLSNEQH